MKTVRFEHRNEAYSATQVSDRWAITKWAMGGSTRISIGSIHTQSKTDNGIIRACRARINAVGVRTSIGSARANAESAFDFGDK